MDRSVLEDKMLARQRREELFDSATIDTLDRLGVGTGWSCLEVGAGRGSIATWLARRVQPSGTVLATDVRQEYLDVLAGLDEPGLTTSRHDVVSDPIAEAAYDIVHARFVLEHLPEREKVITRLVKGLRPGGRLVLEDADFSPCLAEPNTPYATAMRAFVGAMATTGTDYTWTARLPVVLASEGLEHVEASGSVTFFAGASLQAEFWAAQWLDVKDRFALSGLLSTEALEEALISIGDPRMWFAGPMIVTAVGWVTHG